MESPQSPDQPPRDQPGGAEPPPPPGGPQAPSGPQAPGGPPGAPTPAGPPGAPQTPAAPQAPAAPPPPPGPEGPPAYGGSIPQGGWEQPIAQQPGWSGQPLASWGSRAAAILIDWLILLIPVVILTIIVVGVAAGSDTGAIVTGILGLLVFLVVALAYAPVLMAREGQNNGQTWGKQALGIRVVRDNGEAMNFGWAALREIVFKGLVVSIASSIIPIIPWLLNYLWPLWDDQNRALHDMVCSTHVVRA
jgi:uncharacterized RDD family membrane protein YckC